MQYTKIENSLYYGITCDGKVLRLPYKRLHNINKTTYLTKLKELTPSTNNSKGYKRVVIVYKDNTKIYEAVHRLVAKTFIPNPENKPQVNHIDGNKLNNNVSNLEWVTNAENAIHAIQVLKRKSLKGEEGTSKLTTMQVMQLPELLKIKKLGEIAKEFGVGKTTICEIKSGRSWRHLNLFPIKRKKGERFFDESRYVPTTTEK